MSLHVDEPVRRQGCVVSGPQGQQGASEHKVQSMSGEAEEGSRLHRYRAEVEAVRPSDDKPARVCPS